MASYDEWNNAIAEYFISGMPRGATIYLGVDEQVLMDIGAQFEQSEASDVDWVEDFTAAIRSECIISNRVYLERIANYQSDQIPRCVAFLAAMVLAAHRMIREETDTETIGANAYFIRLCEILRITGGVKPRPDGLQTGIEEKLWQYWNSWLIRTVGYRLLDVGTANTTNISITPFRKRCSERPTRKPSNVFFEKRKKRGH